MTLTVKRLDKYNLELSVALRFQKVKSGIGSIFTICNALQCHLI